MDSLYERKDELDEIINGLDSIIDNIKDKYFIDTLNETKYEAQNELDEVEERIWKYEQEEEREMNISFERMRL